MNTPSQLITIGITCFNAQDTIERAIKSATKQDWLNIEIIVVDDFSTDNSIKIIKEIQKTDKRIRLYQHSKNRGYPSALNTIVEHANGNYIAFFDDDDDSQTDRLSKQYKKLNNFQQEHPNSLVLCYAHRRVVINNEERHSAFVHAIGAEEPEPQGRMVADFLLWHKKVSGFSWGEFGSCTMLGSKKLFQKFKFDPNFRRSAEWDLAVRIALNDGYFIAVNEPLVTQYKTDTPDKAGRKPLDYALMLRQKHKSYLKKNNVYLSSIFQAYSRFHYFKGKYWKSRIYLALACITSPSKIMIPEIIKRFKRSF